MDPNTNSFVPVSEETPAQWKRFRVGEMVRIRGIAFTIEDIEPRRLFLQPVEGQEGKNRKQRRKMLAEKRRG